MAPQHKVYIKFEIEIKVFSVFIHSYLLKMAEIPPNPAPQLQMKRVAELIQHAIDAKRPHCVIDEELFDGTKIALREKGYDYKQEKRRTYIGIYPNAAMYATESPKTTLPSPLGYKPCTIDDLNAILHGDKDRYSQVMSQ